VVLEGIHVDAELAQSSPDLREGDYARLSVTDNGCGMNEATLQRIFEPFFTTKATGQGTGLGLSVVHGIMKIHDGAITVHSRPGAGSTFRLYFPAAKTEPLPPRHNRPPAILGHNENILFVDDEEPLAVLASRMLQRLGYRVSSFTNPQLALERFRAAPAQFDAVVSDCAMPGMTGFDLARELRLIRADLPVVLTTGHVRPQDAEAAQRAGVTHLIPKPNTVEQLGETLDRIFASRRSGAAPAIKSANA